LISGFLSYPGTIVEDKVEPSRDVNFANYESSVDDEDILLASKQAWRHIEEKDQESRPGGLRISVEDRVEFSS